METTTAITTIITALCVGIANAIQIWLRSRDKNKQSVEDEKVEIKALESEDVKKLEDTPYTRILLKLLENIHSLERSRKSDSQVIRDIQDRNRAQQETLKHLRKLLEEMKEKPDKEKDQIAGIYRKRGKP